jgi:hypothetical protein
MKLHERTHHGYFTQLRVSFAQLPAVYLIAAGPILSSSDFKRGGIKEGLPSTGCLISAAVFPASL